MMRDENSKKKERPSKFEAVVEDFTFLDAKGND